MQNLNKWGAWLGAGAVLFTLAGCADRNKNGQPDDVATPGEISKSADNAATKTEDAVKDAGNTAATALPKAGATAESAVGKMGKAVEGAADAAVVTPKVKTALGAQKALAGSTIDVDTNGTNNTVTLKGSVKNATQKTLAEAIAKKNAPGFKVVNQLKQGK